MDNDRRIALLEQALVDYIERYGLTELAREAMRLQSKPEPDPPVVGNRGDGPDTTT
ncbi:hypothetical protein SAMN05421774_11266 [Gemmobacter megaterium]|uniref:Uncharacterized protein n=1 Tax=Gemmobacter megaterium TaxID=1086013 RepID=A0A1N7QIS9_9RHOB|nr:hypothetical protein [Gemmobacter megaterium]GGE26528.1 hypothetical protein GCM10011345_35610 [Gemmobacter megaterium]SIT22792.1 hypothetical protein SAMN05421774_11266 [Gemmobacter megaterium]